MRTCIYACYHNPELMKLLEFRECMKTMLTNYIEKYPKIADAENSKEEKVMLENKLPHRVTDVLKSMPSLKVKKIIY
jgi:hypothetical protein